MWNKGGQTVKRAGAIVDDAGDRVPQRRHDLWPRLDASAEVRLRVCSSRIDGFSKASVIHCCKNPPTSAFSPRSSTAEASLPFQVPAASGEGAVHLASLSAKGARQNGELLGECSANSDMLV